MVGKIIIISKVIQTQRQLLLYAHMHSWRGSYCSLHSYTGLEELLLQPTLMHKAGEAIAAVYSHTQG